MLHITNNAEVTHLAVKFFVELQIVETETIVSKDIIEELALLHAGCVAIQLAVVVLRVAETIVNQIVD